MINKIRDIENAFGDGIKNGPRPEELELFKKARRSIVAKNKISKGQVIKDRDIIIKRPNYGIHPSFIEKIIGRKAIDDIEKDAPITWEDI